MTMPVAERVARICIAQRLRLAVTLSLLACVLSACSGSGSADRSAPDSASLRALATQRLGLTGDPATPRDAHQIVPDSDPLVKLGQLLFFSQTLAAEYDVSCGTCHHPDFAGGDGLSLPVGVVPKDPSIVGPGREVDPYRDLDPSADGGPNMHRNSITTFNSALFDRSLMLDGRVFVLDSEMAHGGRGQHIRTPESGQSSDIQGLDGLMQFTVKGPIVNDNEMRGFLYTDLATPTDYREHLVQRLRGNVDTRYNPTLNAARNWLERFRAAFRQPAGTADELVTMPNIQRALAAYVDSQIFVDTPWRRFLAGDDDAISATARRGAQLFLTPRQDGGLGCNGCHAGDRFTDEGFHDVGIPQIGRGFNFSEHYDKGRWFATRIPDDAQAFRTPSLLNVAKTAPYGHTGSFDTLAELLAYHADPRHQVDRFDFSLKTLTQFRGAMAYPYAEQFTREAIARPGFARAEAMLPARALKKDEIRQLVAFLETLTDACVAKPACIQRWAPTIADDPDGHTLVRNHPKGTPPDIDAQRPSDYAPRFALHFPAGPPRATFADLKDCQDKIGYGGNLGRNVFELRTERRFGLTDRHGYGTDTWFNPQQSTIEVTMNGGGVTAAYVDDDCWPDLIFSGGDVSGMRFYRNEDGRSFAPMRALDKEAEREFSGAAVADLNGDYRRELVFGNIKPGFVPIYGATGNGRYRLVADLPMVRPTYGISFAPLDDTGFPYMYLAHWALAIGTNGSSPALWKFDGQNVYPWDTNARTSSAFVNQKFNFTPKFADFDGDGRIDLVLTSDFSTSSTLRNVPDAGGGWHFVDDTDGKTISDENGMGSALLDVDNDGTLEWFVTSIMDATGSPQANWGISGNRMYRNTSTAGHISFTDITDHANVRHGYWGWGACAADFNNDGFIDLFHADGFGRIPDDVVKSDKAREMQAHYDEITRRPFQGKPSRLFINNGDGSFTEKAAEWGISAPSEGRGVACFDYNRDGDVDIVVFNHSGKLQFFENRSGSGEGHHFLDVRLVGASPNTDAIGARVYATANLGSAFGVQTQLRLSEANSNFNSQNLPNLHFGLRYAPVVERLRVVWPGGGELVCRNVPANSFIVLDQRSGQAACPAQGGSKTLMAGPSVASH